MSRTHHNIITTFSAKNVLAFKRIVEITQYLPVDILG